MAVYEEIIEDLYTLIDEGKSSMGGSRVKIDGEAAKELLEKLKESIPEQLVQARRIVADRNSILEEANRKRDDAVNEANQEKNRILSEATDQRDQILAEARKKAAVLTSEHQITENAREAARITITDAQDRASKIVDEANNRANAVVNAANRWSENVKNAVSQYCTETLGTVQEVCARLVVDLQKQGNEVSTKTSRLRGLEVIRDKVPKKAVAPTAEDFEPVRISQNAAGSDDRKTAHGVSQPQAVNKADDDGFFDQNGEDTTADFDE